MNPPKNHQPRVPANRNPQSGAALILVLASLIFVSVLTVAFLASMRSKLVLAKSGADAGNVRLLAGTAVNIAISQVRDATKKSGAQNLAWASQPGMIRLYDDKGAAAGYYKLYSADNMVETSGAFDPAAEAIPAGWAADPAVFTDLNAPSGGLFPILDSAAASGVGVQGFSLGTVPGATTSQPAPMPVKWLYVLQDGSLHAAGPGSSGTKAVIPAATAANPIVGRIAFWADDETCKVNVNTASDGTFWATPRFNTAGDQQLARSQPARGEFQRYPGHPATVSLRSVFPSLKPEQVFAIAPRLSWGGSKGGTEPVQNVTQWIETDRDRLYDSVDEVLFGVPSGGDRSLQAGLDLINTRAARFFLTASSRAPELNLFGLPRVLSWPIHAVNDNNYRTVNDRLLAFCATLGGPPPAATYPFYFTRQENVLPEFDISLPRNVELLDYLDRLTARPVPGFGGSLQDASKYGQTETRQILTQIFDYIRCANLLDQTTTNSIAGVRTNYPYAFGLSSHPKLAKGSLHHPEAWSLGTAAPAYHADWDTRGFGGRFLQPRAAHLHFVGVGEGERGTTPADYKPPVPVYDNNTVISGASNNATNSLQVRQHGERLWPDNYPDEESIATALSKGGTNSLGEPNFPYNPIPYNFEGNNIPPPNTTAVQAFFYLTTLTPGEGTENWSPGHWIEFEGLDQFEVNLNPAEPGYTSLGFPAKAEMTIKGNMMGGGGVVGGRVASLELLGFTFAQNQMKFLSSSPGGDHRRRFTAFSAILPVASTNISPTMAFKGGTVTLRIFADAQRGTTTPSGSVARGVQVGEYKLTFPDATFPTPRLAVNRLVGAPDPINATNGKVVVNGAFGLREERWGVSPAQGASASSLPFRLFDTNNDVLRSVALAEGDIRLLVGPATTNSFFQAQTGYFNSSSTNRMVPAAVAAGIDLTKSGRLVKDAPHISPFSRPFVPDHINGVTTSSGAPGDWDNGTSTTPDGPFINAPDAGSVQPVDYTANSLPYYDNAAAAASAVSQFFSPNRQMPGPGMFGSLSTGVQRRLPWQTLLFRPGPSGHPGSVAPADHLLLDLFWMPIVEPYAISEPFSTAGKINMNQQLVPFTYINRMVGLRAAMAAEQVAMVAKGQASSYKRNNPGSPLESRKPLNLSETDGTLRQFREKFAKGEIFRSATEICDIYLVPDGRQWASDAAAQSAWYGDDFAMVGDNVRERPYAHLHNKLTTKSNVFTVHYRAQALQKSKASNASDPTVFDTGAGDRVAGEERGSTTFERYLDPNDSRIVDPAKGGGDPARIGATSLEEFYRARIVNTSVFNP